MKRLILLILLVLATYANPAFAAPCSNAPLPRLQIGDEAVVAREADGLTLRALPAVSTGVDAKLYSGNHLKVIGGPSCNGGYNWWRVQTDRGTKGWVAEGSWAYYYVVPLEDAQQPPSPIIVLGQVVLKLLLRMV